MRQCNRNVQFHTDVTPSLLPACLAMATGPCNTLAVNKCLGDSGSFQISLLQDCYPSPLYYIMHKNMELVRTMKKTKSHYWQVQGRQRGLQFQMEGCKQKKKPKRGTARGKEKGKKNDECSGEKKDHQRDRQGP